MTCPIQLQAALLELEQAKGGAERETLRQARAYIRRASLDLALIASVADEARGCD